MSATDDTQATALLGAIRRMLVEVSRFAPREANDDRRAAYRRAGKAAKAAEKALAAGDVTSAAELMAMARAAKPSAA